MGLFPLRSTINQAVHRTWPRCLSNRAAPAPHEVGSSTFQSIWNSEARGGGSREKGGEPGGGPRGRPGGAPTGETGAQGPERCRGVGAKGGEGCPGGESGAHGHPPGARGWCGHRRGSPPPGQPAVRRRPGARGQGPVAHTAYPARIPGRIQVGGRPAAPAAQAGNEERSVAGVRRLGAPSPFHGRAPGARPPSQHLSAPRRLSARRWRLRHGSLGLVLGPPSTPSLGLRVTGAEGLAAAAPVPERQRRWL